MSGKDIWSRYGVRVDEGLMERRRGLKERVKVAEGI
jgi:hypothetical protein